MAEKERILVVDDEPSIRKYLGTLLEVDGYQVEAVVSGREAVEKIEGGDRPDFIILDVLMPELNGLETLKQLMQIDRSLNVVMLSCSNEVGTVVEAIRLGAQDYLTKPFEKAELDVAMLKCRQKQQLRAENKSLREYCDAITEDICFLAASPQMVRIRQQILQIAPVDVPVFIYGESGVGKEVVARMIHMRSTRRSQAFIKVNCAALPGELLESELFGFEQGAFTGAVRNRGDESALAGQVAARPPGPPVLTARRPQFDRRRCACAGRDQRGDTGGDEVGPPARGPLLSSERPLDQRAPAARAHH
jgi:two-component system, NtrC family, response regulator AtoC